MLVVGIVLLGHGRETALVDAAEANGIVMEPYWWEFRDYGSAGDAAPVGARYDAAIIGSGYTGLVAAHKLAMNGLSVVVLESEDLGYGASTRNAGMVSGTLKPSYRQLCQSYGREMAEKLVREAQESVGFIENLISDNSIDCDYRRTGMYLAAHSSKHYDALAREVDELAALGIETYMVPEGRQHHELGTEFYFGGRTTLMAGALHPAKYHAGLVGCCRQAGVAFRTRCRVHDIVPSNGSYELISECGKFYADQIVVATNAYTSAVTPWLQSRIIPIGSYILATEAVDSGRLAALIPSRRVVQDTKRNLFYCRLSPDGTRMIFGGRASFRPIEAMESTRRLKSAMASVFPSLADIRISHSWTGNVAFTFQKIPHVGRHGGIHFALGCCGQGVALMSYLGDQVANAILDRGSGTCFTNTRFSSIPWYRGNPWFLPIVGEFYRLLDWLDRDRSA